VLRAAKGERQRTVTCAPVVMLVATVRHLPAGYGPSRLFIISVQQEVFKLAETAIEYVNLLFDGFKVEQGWLLHRQPHRERHASRRCRCRLQPPQHNGKLKPVK
jgi:hypothetical protein